MEILHFSNYTGDAENSVMRETWARVLDQALAAGGVAEACTVVRRLGPQFYPSDGGSMPIHTICLQLEIAAHVFSFSPFSFNSFFHLSCKPSTLQFVFEKVI